MKAVALAFGLLSAIAQVAAAPSPALTVFEKLASIPQGWKQGASVPPEKLIRFRIALKQANAHEFEQHVIDISTPGHSKYGMHMTQEELKRSLRPSSEATEAIIGWLKAEGVEHVLDDGNWINFAVPVGKAEQILDTKYIKP